jgi:hypothetical protein
VTSIEYAGCTVTLKPDELANEPSFNRYVVNENSLFADTTGLNQVMTPYTLDRYLECKIPDVRLN